MRVADLAPSLIHGSGAGVGIVLGLAAGALADALPRRYGITQLVRGKRRARRNVLLLVLATAASIGIAHVLANAGEMSIAQAAALLAMNAIVCAAVLTAAAIDLEHMILPNELTLGPAALCLVLSPVRSIGLVGSIAGAAVGLALSYLPALLYRKVRGQAGMGVGDAKLALLAGAWHGIEGAVVVLFTGALQSALTAFVMRRAGIRYAVPESVKAEIAELRARAEAGDAAAASELADDPMAAEEREGTLAMRLPLGPFLALGCIEVLFFRRWIVEQALGWLMR